MKVKVTSAFEAWVEELDTRERKQVVQGVRKLELMGMELPHPHSSALHGTRFALRELRRSR